MAVMLSECHSQNIKNEAMNMELTNFEIKVRAEILKRNE